MVSVCFVTLIITYLAGEKKAIGWYLLLVKAFSASPLPLPFRPRRACLPILLSLTQVKVFPPESPRFAEPGLPRQCVRRFGQRNVGGPSAPSTGMLDQDTNDNGGFQYAQKVSHPHRNSTKALLFPVPPTKMGSFSLKQVEVASTPDSDCKHPCRVPPPMVSPGGSHLNVCHNFVAFRLV